ncbi:MAG: NYN domain-containing protein, partial [Tissierellia bacterium]|nr:NYN domain-containing protein [Tissierellia bacterium]
TEENETADHYIEKSLEDNIFKKIRVATSDRMEQQIILGKGGIRMSAKELEAEVAAYKRLVNYKIKKDKVKQKRSMGKLSENNLKALEKFLKE